MKVKAFAIGLAISAFACVDSEKLAEDSTAVDVHRSIRCVNKPNDSTMKSFQGQEGIRRVRVGPDGFATWAVGHLYQKAAEARPFESLCSYLREHVSMFGICKPEARLRVRDTWRMPPDERLVIVCAQYEDSVEVEGGKLTAHFLHDTALVLIMSAIEPTLPSSLSPVISRENAIGIALSDRRVRGRNPHLTEIVLVVNIKGRLAWRLVIRGDWAVGTTCYVDAITGEAVWREARHGMQEGEGATLN